MPFCPNKICNGTGKFSQSINCPDCDGKGWVSDKMFNFIEFYYNKKKVEDEINQLEIESGEMKLNVSELSKD